MKSVSYEKRERKAEKGKKKKKIPQNNGFIMKGISLTEQIVLENSPNLKGI